MVTRLALAMIIGLTGACQRTPEQQQADELRGHAQARGATIRNQADTEADRLELQANTLHIGAEQAGGYTGQRLKVRADSLSKEARIVRKQGDKQADALEETADAQVKTSESR